MVRIGAVRARGDDHELDRAVPLLDERCGDVGRDLALGASGAQEAGHAAVHGVDGVAGAAQLGDLGRVLDHAALAQHGRREFGAGIQTRRQRNHVQCREGIGDAEPRDGSAHRRGHESIRILAVHPVRHGESQRADRGVAHLREFHARHDDRRFPVAGITSAVSRSIVSPSTPAR